MRTGSLLLAVLMLTSAFIPMAVADEPATDVTWTSTTIDTIDGRRMTALQPRAAGPFGPSQATVVYDSGTFAGDFGGLRFTEDLDGDGDLDHLFYVDNGDGTYNLRALDLGARDWLWDDNWTAPGFEVGFGVVDFDGDGAKEVYWRTFTNFFVIHGANGTEAWRRPCSNLGGYGMGDIDNDGDIEVMLTENQGWNVYVNSYNGTTGAREWVSGAVNGGSNPRPAQLDDDAQKEVVMATWSGGGSGVAVIDAVQNVTEWTKGYAFNTMLAVGDINGSGKDNVLVRRSSSPFDLILYGQGGTQLWTNNSYSSSAFINRLFETDGDASLEIVSSDYGDNGVEIINGGNGHSQGTWTCATHPPVDTRPLDPESAGGSDLVTYGPGASDWQVALLDGTNASGLHRWRYTYYPNLYYIDVDGDGLKEVVIRTHDINGLSNGQIYVYNYTNRREEWNNKSIGYGFGAAFGWVMGKKTENGSKVLDIITASTSGTQNPSSLVWLAGDNTSSVKSTQTYPQPWFKAVDTEGDGFDELLLTTNTFSGSQVRIYILKVDQPPQVNGTIPTLQVEEDGTATGVFDVADLFKDDGMSGVLDFLVVPPSGTMYVNATLNGTMLDLEAVVQDWNGATNITVAANDTVNDPVEVDIPVTVLPMNDPPTFGPVADKEVNEDEVSIFTVQGDDIDGDALTYSDNSSLFDIDPITGVINFTPTNDDVGIHEVTVTAQDPTGESASVEFNVTVLNTNDPPSIVTDDVLVAHEDDLYSVVYEATDIDVGTAVFTWSIVTNGSWLAMNATSGELHGTPTNDEVGLWGVNVTVDDGAGGRDHQEFTVEVVNTNDAPTWVDVPGNASLEDTETYYGDADAEDIDVGDVLSYGISSDPPSSISIDPATGEISWTMLAVGTFTIDITAFDGIVTIHHEFEIEVYHIYDNASPFATLVAPANGAEIDILDPVLEWTVSDPEGDPVEVDLFLGTDEALVEAFDPTVNLLVSHEGTTFKVDPPLQKGSTYYWTVRPFDGYTFGDCTNGVWSFKVKETAIVNHPPTLDDIPDQKTTTGSPFSLQVQGHDEDPVDADRLVYGINGQPAGMKIDAATGLITWAPSDNQAGNYTVNVTLTDGKELVSRSFRLEVVKKTNGNGGGGDDDDDGGLLGELFLPLMLLVIIIVVLVIVAVALRRRKRERPSPPPKAHVPAPVAEEPATPPPAPVATVATEETAPATEPPPEDEPAPETSEEDVEDEGAEEATEEGGQVEEEGEEQAEEDVKEEEAPEESAPVEEEAPAEEKVEEETPAPEEEAKAEEKEEEGELDFLDELVPREEMDRDKGP